jgi:two-component system sensor kinase FixL
MERRYDGTHGNGFGHISLPLLDPVLPQPVSSTRAELLGSDRLTGKLADGLRELEIARTASQRSLPGNRGGQPVRVNEVNDAIARHKLEEMRQALARIESSHEAIIGKTPESIVSSWNSGAEAMFGYTRDEMIGRSITVIFPPDRLMEEAAILARMRRGEPLEHYESVRRRKDGTLIEVSLIVSPIRDANGTIIGILKIARDLGERRRAAAHLDQLRLQLFHLSRLASMSQMATMLAHELSQPLSAVATYLASLRRLAVEELGASPLFEELAGKAIEQSERASEIVRHLRIFIAKGEADRRPADVNEVVHEAITIGLVDVNLRGIETTIHLVPDLPKVLIERIQIEQVVINLLRNAADALQDSDERRLQVETALNAGMVAIRVIDTGPGIAPEIAERLFQPFATTKSTGLGLGLSICREIVEAHGGQLRVEASNPRGAIFTVTLPAADEAPSGAPARIDDEVG